MIGLELGGPVAAVARRREPTGSPIGFVSDGVATAKRDIRAGEMLDGEGGYCVWGKQTPADDSLRNGYLPLGLAHNVKLKRDVAKGERLAWADIQVDETSQAVKVRRAMEARFARPNEKAASSDKHTSELPSLMRRPYAVICLHKKNIKSKRHRSN